VFLSHTLLSLSYKRTIFCTTSFRNALNINTGKVHPTTRHEGILQEYTYRFTFSFTSALDGGGWLTPRPGRFASGKETGYPLHRTLGEPQGKSRRMKKTSLPGFEPRTIHSITSRHTDYTVPAYRNTQIHSTQTARRPG
jgi:hypothetical protein